MVGSHIFGLATHHSTSGGIILPPNASSVFVCAEPVRTYTTLPFNAGGSILSVLPAGRPAPTPTKLISVTDWVNSLASAALAKSPRLFGPFLTFALARPFLFLFGAEPEEDCQKNQGKPNGHPAVGIVVPPKKGCDEQCHGGHLRHHSHHHGDRKSCLLCQQCLK